MHTDERRPLADIQCARGSVGRDPSLWVLKSQNRSLSRLSTIEYFFRSTLILEKGALHLNGSTSLRMLYLNFDIVDNQLTALARVGFLLS